MVLSTLFLSIYGRNTGHTMDGATLTFGTLLLALGLCSHNSGCCCCMRSDGGRPVRPSGGDISYITIYVCCACYFCSFSPNGKRVFNCMRCLTHGSCSIRPWTPERDTDRSSASAHHNRVE